MVTIYLLRRHDWQPIYVGKTNDVPRRLREHKRKLGFAPRHDVLEVCDDDGWPEAEARWTRHYQDLGFDLLNRMVGDAQGVQTHSESTRTLLSTKGKGKPKPPGFGDKIRAARKGKPQNWSPEGRERVAIGHANVGRAAWDKADDSARARMLANLNTRSPQEVSEQLLARWADPETKERIRANMREAWKRRKARDG
jgi:hypothetical protein